MNGSLRVHVLSDLHMDTFSDPWRAPRVDADVLVLAGDLFDDARRSMEWCARAHKDLGKPVIFVPGNHDFYDGCLQDVIEAMREQAASAGVHFLHNESIVLGGVRFVGATLWTDYSCDGSGLRGISMHAAEQFMQDFRSISYRDGSQVRAMTPADALKQHEASLIALQEGLEDAYTEPVVVITHHAPLTTSLHSQYAGSALNPSMASDLDELVRHSCARLWIHGHVHQSFDYVCGSTRVVCNPRGSGAYVNPLFEPGLTLSLTLD